MNVSLYYGGIFNVAELERNLAMLEDKAADPALWLDPEKARAHEQERSDITRFLTSFHAAEKTLSDADDLMELAAEDEEFAAELDESLQEVLNIVEKLAIEIPPNNFNTRYLETKRDKLGHLILNEKIENSNKK